MEDNISLLEYINNLESDSFEGWSEEAISGYLTACQSIKNKVIEYDQRTV